MKRHFYFSPRNGIAVLLISLLSVAETSCIHSAPSDASLRNEQESKEVDPPHPNDVSRRKDETRIHHIFEEVYPNSSASSVLIFGEKHSKIKGLHSKGGHPRQSVTVTLGTGIVLNQQGYVLTNAHTIRSYDQIGIQLKSGKSYEALVIGLDKRIDLAILKVEPDEDIVPVERLDTYSLQIGERAIRKYVDARETIKKNQAEQKRSQFKK
ncbi:serine protease [Leptospira gomenensis]|uniref:Serine protease n=1 Tax=Leptospira gomenensis TaxID=2484974 RepID=A0A5F1YVD3_9LEPT|nr:trypsin-like peptidase domain-containing protein [Leptospira gomenensis]TGK31824.1 serine protease [Leptospira gomenensis]TGK41549.1 serine protease [Leptospira gomenensis]TGK41714.1 serine protease [Leptospira gomenensis]TGK61493.1 serine protease [Leptospira gomenensis]